MTTEGADSFPRLLPATRGLWAEAVAAAGAGARLSGGSGPTVIRPPGGVLRQGGDRREGTGVEAPTAALGGDTELRSPKEGAGAPHPTEPTLEKGVVGFGSGLGGPGHTILQNSSLPRLQLCFLGPSLGIAAVA